MKDVPVVINNFLRLTSLQNLVNSLYSRGYFDITVLDNGSFYDPLLLYYKGDSRIKVRYLRNSGPRALWGSGLMRELKHKYVLYTDSDIELPDEVPDNFVDRMVEVMEKYPEYRKVGLSLQINDLPDHYPYKKYIQAHEKKYWENRLEKDVYVADVDTTMALLHTGDSFTYTAIRLGGVYTVKHRPWYEDFNDLTDEELFIIKHSSDDSTQARLYKQWIKEQSSL